MNCIGPCAPAELRARSLLNPVSTKLTAASISQVDAEPSLALAVEPEQRPALVATGRFGRPRAAAARRRRQRDEPTARVQGHPLLPVEQAAPPAELGVVGGARKSRCRWSAQPSRPAASAPLHEAPSPGVDRRVQACRRAGERLLRDGRGLPQRRLRRGRRDQRQHGKQDFHAAESRLEGR